MTKNETGYNCILHVFSELISISLEFEHFETELETCQYLKISKMPICAFQFVKFSHLSTKDEALTLLSLIFSILHLESCHWYSSLSPLNEACVGAFNPV